MTHSSIPAAAAALLAASGILSAQEPDTADFDQQAQAIIQEFASTLKGELQTAIKEGGPVNAVSVCKERAPAIAASLSEQTGWDVGRTSLKLRNPALNAPDDWERSIMEQFETRLADGEPAETLSHAEVVETAAGKGYRYMKAIPTAEICLTCHGGELDPTLAEALDEAYPEDQARGYSAGDIRGAFTLNRPL